MTTMTMWLIREWLVFAVHLVGIVLVPLAMVDWLVVAAWIGLVLNAERHCTGHSQTVFGRGIAAAAALAMLAAQTVAESLEIYWPVVVERGNWLDSIQDHLLKMDLVSFAVGRVNKRRKCDSILHVWYRQSTHGCSSIYLQMLMKNISTCGDGVGCGELVTGPSWLNRCTWWCLWSRCALPALSATLYNCSMVISMWCPGAIAPVIDGPPEYVTPFDGIVWSTSCNQKIKIALLKYSLHFVKAFGVHGGYSFCLIDHSTTVIGGAAAALKPVSLLTKEIVRSVSAANKKYD